MPYCWKSHVKAHIWASTQDLSRIHSTDVDEGPDQMFDLLLVNMGVCYWHLCICDKYRLIPRTTARKDSTTDMVLPL